MSQAREDQEASSGEQLGAYLKRLRELKGLTQRQVEEASKKLEGSEPVSNAYLSQLETEKVTDPSPRLLRTLAIIYAVPFRTVMIKARYLRPEEAGLEGARLATFVDHGLTPEEEREAIEYIRFRRRYEDSADEEG